MKLYRLCTKSFGPHWTTVAENKVQALDNIKHHLTDIILQTNSEFHEEKLIEISDFDSREANYTWEDKELNEVIEGEIS